MQKLVLASRQTESGLEIPDLNLSEKPWIPEREWTICVWTPRNVRGVFVNPYADNRLNIWLFSDAQWARYVETFDWFGFSGAQLTDVAYSFGVFGSVEAFQDKLKMLAHLAHENGQNVSLWVWAAEFGHNDWADPDVNYNPAPGLSAFDDPNVRKGFEKYYDDYAELAPHVDRLIGHFYDPGHLTSRQDVFNYMRLLEGKFRARNPQVKMAIDLWGTEPGYFDQLINNGFKDYLLLEMGLPSVFKPEQREKVHEAAKRLGLELGVWGWHETEYETDQFASMYVNGYVLKELYQQIKNGAARTYPLHYWSEMEAHHLNNLCSMYLAGQLLWNPDRDPDEIMAEFTEGIWGPQNGPKVLAALKLIQDARSGPSWNTYYWNMPGHRLGTADPKEDLRRAESALAELENLKKDPGRSESKFPLPVSPETLLDLMLPHLKQIRAFAEFRIELEQIRTAWQGGAPKEEISRRLAQAWKPIPEYDTWIGTFGQIERREQEIQLRKLAGEAGVSLTEPAWLRAQDAGRLLQEIQNLQRKQPGERLVKVSELKEFMWPKDKLNNRFEKLIADGWLEKVGEDTYRLANWQEYAR